MIDFNKFLTQFEGWSVEGQIKWLQGKNIPQIVIDHVIAEIYKEIEQGKKFIDGDSLDKELLKRCKDNLNLELKQLTELYSARMQRFEEYIKLGQFHKLWLVITGKL